jgi:hypothetical protein
LFDGIADTDGKKGLEVLAVIVDWDTPFAIVILEHQRIIDADPGAPFNCCTAHKLKTVP